MNAHQQLWGITIPCLPNSLSSINPRLVVFMLSWEINHFTLIYEIRILLTSCALEGWNMIYYAISFVKICNYNTFSCTNLATLVFCTFILHVCTTEIFKRWIKEMFAGTLLPLVSLFSYSSCFSNCGVLRF